MNSSKMKKSSGSTAFGLMAIGTLVGSVLYASFGISSHDVGPLAAIPLFLVGGGLTLFFTIMSISAAKKESDAGKKEVKAAKKSGGTWIGIGIVLLAILISVLLKSIF